MVTLPRSRSVLFGLLALFQLHTWAQCPNDNSVSGSAITVACPGAISGGNIAGGRYALVNVVTGNTYTFSTCGASYDTHITLYRNTGGTLEGSNDDACNGNRSAVQWTASFTGQLRVLVDRGNCNTNTTTAPLWITCALNDEPCTATLLTVGATCVNTAGTNIGATANPVHADPSCSTYSGGDVWFRAVAPASGNLLITVTSIGGSALTDGVLAVYSASSCSTALTEIACNDNSPLGGTQPRIALSGLTVGATYYIRFWEDGNNAFGTFNICAVDPPIPVNDNPCLATALSLGASCTNTTSNNEFATNTAGIPAPSCGGYAGGDVWFSFTAPASGQAIITSSAVAGSPHTDGAMAVYAATGCNGTYTEIACNDDPPSGGLMPRILLTGLTTGTTYYVRCWERDNDAPGQFNICITTPAAPANNTTCTATALTVGTACSNVTGTTAGSSSSTGVPAPTCGDYQGNDVWFRAVAPASGRLTVNTTAITGSALTNAAMAIYSATACGGTFTQVGCNDDGMTSTMPSLSFTGLTGGATYYIRIWAAGNTTFGTFSICAFEHVINDEPCGAILLPVGTTCSLTAGTNVAATNTTGYELPGCLYASGSRDVWYRFVAPSTGIAVVQSTANSLTDGVMAVYESSSCAPSGMALLECNDDGGTGLMPFQRFADLTPGATYYIRFWGYGTSTGTFNLCVWSPALPAGNCAYFLEMFDSGKNGWGTSAVQVQINGGPVVNHTVPSGFYNCALIGLNTGALLQVNYVNTGNNQNQNRYQIRQIPGGFGVLKAGPSPAAGIVLLETIDCIPPDPPIEDCRGGRALCTAEAFSNSTLDVGFDADLSARNFGCLATAEKRGTWYHFNPTTSGLLGFTIAPAAANVDYDFAVWGPTTAIVCKPQQPPVRCNYSPQTGNTGLSSAGTNPSEGGGSGNSKWSSLLPVVAGEFYSLYVSNFDDANPNTAFTLTWDLTSGASLGCTLLPVEFIGLQAELVNDAAEVRWSTASETNASHYRVERSTDAFNYSPIGHVQAMGNTTSTTAYSFLDNSPVEGLNYYRVQQVDVDGHATASPADYVIYRKRSTGMVVFPNPAGDILFASFNMPEDGAVIWRILDANGRLLEQDLYQGARGDMLIDVPLERFAAGTYILLVNDAQGRMSQVAHFIKH